MSERLDLASALLLGDRTERERLLRSVDPETLEMSFPQLTRQRDAAAAEVLALIDEVIDDKAVRKAARRELHRLRSVGVHLPVNITAVEPEAVDRVAAPLPVTEAWASDIDPTGTRALWIVADRPLGGIWFGALLLNLDSGVQDMNLIDTTRKRFAAELASVRSSETTLVRLPGDYALGLVREAVDLSRASGKGLLARYKGLKDAFGEASAAPQRALVYDTISPVEVEFNPTWLEQSPRLVPEPEIKGWHITVSPELRSKALDVARSPATGFLVPGHTPAMQAQQLVAQAADQALTPAARRSLRRRLEETAFIFLQTDRLPAARAAVAAAHALEDTPAGPRVPAERHPLVRLLLAGGLARLVGSEQVQGRPAAEVLVELIEQSSPTSSSGGPVETRPSGLILPR